MRTKIKAFTLGELLIVLILTVIAVGIAFSVLRLITYQLGTVKSIYKEQNMIYHFKQQLRYDFDRAIGLYHDVEDEKIYVYTANDTIGYEFSEKQIFRKNVKTSFESVSFMGYSFGNEKEGGQLDAVQFRISINKREISVFARINSSATMYLE
jgi:hypothetical protein